MIFQGLCHVSFRECGENFGEAQSSNDESPLERVKINDRFYPPVFFLNGCFHTGGGETLEPFFCGADAAAAAEGKRSLFDEGFLIPRCNQ